MSNLRVTAPLPALPPLPSPGPARQSAPVPGTAQLAPRDVSRLSPQLRKTSPLNQQMVYLGLNGAEQEVSALTKQAGRHQVHVVANQPDGQLQGFDLTQENGIANFAASLQLSPAATAALTTYLTELDVNVRDEMAQLAQLWAPAERGETIPSRLVLSGHSTGRGIFGEKGRGRIEFAAFGHLAAILPQAAAQIEDIHLGGCNTGFRVNSEIFQANFPQLKTLWAYLHTAPSEATGSPAHLRRWESLTRGGADKLTRDQAARGFGAGSHPENIVVWSAAGGYQSSEKAVSMSEAELQQAVERYLSGEAESVSPGSGFLKEVYDQLQSVRGNSSDAESLKRHDALIDRSLKLRYYRNVASNFQAVFGPELRRVAQELGQSAPDFDRLSRREALLASQHLQRAITARHTSETGVSPAQERARVLLAALDDLSPALMDETWIEPRLPAEFESLRSQSAGLRFEDVQAARIPAQTGWLDGWLQRYFQTGQGLPSLGLQGWGTSPPTETNDRIIFSP
ncbi:MAG: hypothetical protein ACO1RX_07450 [Candidatus Sericytochromatia bacterium]